MYNKKISIILPCRNEEDSIAICIEKIQKTIEKNNIDAEIIVSDSSNDGSYEIARKFDVVLIKHDKEGYGNAYMEAFKYASGDILILGDADDTYDFEEIPKFLEKINNSDLVLGNRKYIHKKAMPFINRYLGNPLLSLVLRVLFGSKIKDCHTGFRAIKKEALEKLNLRTTGMEFASEMIIMAIKNNLKIEEIDISYYPRKGKSKLRKIPDGWRHLRFMLLYSPLYLFFIPGFLMLMAGIISIVVFYIDLNIFKIKIYYHPMFISSFLIISGYQLIFFSIFAKTYATTHLKEKSFILEKFYKKITIESGSILGIVFLILGFLIYLKIFYFWTTSGFNELNEIKNSIVALTLILLGIQTISSSFMLSILSIKEKNE